MATFSASMIDIVCFGLEEGLGREGGDGLVGGAGRTGALIYCGLKLDNSLLEEVFEHCLSVLLWYE